MNKECRMHPENGVFNFPFIQRCGDFNCAKIAFAQFARIPKLRKVPEILVKKTEMPDSTFRMT